MAGNKVDSTELSDRELQTDIVFRALGEYNRREMLRIVQKNPGITLGDIADRFVISRFAVMKHLNILEAANLIRRETQGKSKLHFYQHAPVSKWVLPWLNKLEG